MASLSLFPQFETNLMSNRKVIELLLQLKSARAHVKYHIKVKPYLIRHVLRICLLKAQTPKMGNDRESVNSQRLLFIETDLFARLFS